VRVPEEDVGPPSREDVAHGHRVGAVPPLGGAVAVQDGLELHDLAALASAVEVQTVACLRRPRVALPGSRLPDPPPEPLRTLVQRAHQLGASPDLHRRHRAIRPAEFPVKPSHHFWRPDEQRLSARLQLDCRDLDLHEATVASDEGRSRPEHTGAQSRPSSERGVRGLQRLMAGRAICLSKRLSG
jgi:hypothetical protein